MSQNSSWKNFQILRKPNNLINTSRTQGRPILNWGRTMWITIRFRKHLSIQRQTQKHNSQKKLKRTYVPITSNWVSIVCPAKLNIQAIKLSQKWHKMWYPNRENIIMILEIKIPTLKQLILLQILLTKYWKKRNKSMWMKYANQIYNWER